MHSKFTHMWTAAIFLLSLCICRCNGQQCSAEDSEALVRFKAGFTDPGNMFRTWQAGTSCCTWSGVKCSSSGRVSELSVFAPFPTRGPTPRRDPAYPGVTGATLGDLSELVGLQLDGIAFDGPMPNTFGKLKKLESLSLNFNNFSGSVSASIGDATALKTLFISLYGPYPVVGLVPAPIPFSFCNLVNLRSLRVNFGMTGKIPSCFCKFTQLTALDLSSNKLVSDIPDCMGDTLLQLESFNLASNNFTGPVPKWLTNLTKVNELRLSENQFRGVIPWNIGDMVNLETLALNNNFLWGHMPASFGRCTKMTFLDLSSNYLTRLTIGLGKMVNLSTCLLYSNEFGGRLLQQIGRAGSQGGGLYFDISENRLQGHVGILELTSSKFTDFIAAKNFFVGPFPLELAKTCYNIDLSDNFLGNWPQYGHPPASSGLTRLSLRNNNFSGPVPSWLISLRDLTSATIHEFDISGNKFSGPFPVALLGNRIPNLQLLNASYNMFSCPLPTQSFNGTSMSFTVDLSHNMISGPITSTFFASLIDSYYLDLSFNKLIGPLPANSSGAFAQLVYMDLSHNQLSGRVPASVEKILSLRYLDLSKNAFTGKVPSIRPPPGTEF